MSKIQKISKTINPKITRLAKEINELSETLPYPVNIKKRKNFKKKLIRLLTGFNVCLEVLNNQIIIINL